MTDVGKLTVGTHIGAPIGINTNPSAPNGGSATGTANTYGTEILPQCNISKAISTPVNISTIANNDETTAIFIGNCGNLKGYVGINIDTVSDITNTASAFVLVNASSVTQTVVVFVPTGGAGNKIFNNIVLHNAGDYVTFELASNRTLFFGTDYVLHL
jgi:hypothetical protein